MKLSILLSAATSALLIAGSAQAFEKSTSERADEIMERMDVNQDGVIDQADRDAKQAERFAKIDTDGDGYLTQDELAAARQTRHEARAERRENRRGRMIEKLDQDGDGVLSEEEFNARPDRGEAGERGHRRGKRGKRGKGGHGKLLKDADTNGDGAVDRAELEAALEAHQAKRAAHRNGS